MNINIKDILTLDDDKEYIVVSKIYYDGKDYLYLVEVNNTDNLKFCCLAGDILTEITDKELNAKLLPLFFGKVKQILQEE